MTLNPYYTNLVYAQMSVFVEALNKKSNPKGRVYIFTKSSTLGGDNVSEIILSELKFSNKKMILEEKIRISEVKELDSHTNEWSEFCSRIKNKIQNYKRQVITIEFLDKLLDLEGEIEEAWFSVTYDHPYNYISYRTLPVTETRKKNLKERDKKKGIKGYVVDEKPISIEEFDGYTNSNLVLYLRKVYDQNEFRIGIFDIKWVSAGMSEIPQTEQIKDLLALSYEKI